MLMRRRLGDSSINKFQILFLGIDWFGMEFLLEPLTRLALLRLFNQTTLSALIKQIAPLCRDETEAMVFS